MKQISVIVLALLAIGASLLAPSSRGSSAAEAAIFAGGFEDAQGHEAWRTRFGGFSGNRAGIVPAGQADLAGGRVHAEAQHDGALGADFTADFAYEADLKVDPAAEPHLMGASGRRPGSRGSPTAGTAGGRREPEAGGPIDPAEGGPMKGIAIESTQPQEGQHVVHLAISNQSIAQPRATLHVMIDGQAVFDRDLETKTQHNWQELTRSLRSGPHLVEVQELSTGTAQRLHLDLAQETWVIIMFSSPPPTLSILAQQTPANFL